MSNVEWMAGAVVVPAAEIAHVKRTLRKRYNTVITNAYDEAKRFRAANTTTSLPKWLMAIDLEAARVESDNLPKHLALAVARSMSQPRAIKWENFEEVGLGRLGVGATKMHLFSNGGERIGAARFQSRKITWEIFEGNHAVDTFRDSKDGAFFYETLASVPWVKGTGGWESYFSEGAGEIVEGQRFGGLKKRYEHIYPTHHTLPRR